MDTDDESQLAHERHHATTEERKVLALEMIADHLEKISRGLAAADDLGAGRAAFAAMAANDGDKGVADRWDSESEYAELDPQDASSIKRTLVEHFAVGGYNYTN